MPTSLELLQESSKRESSIECIDLETNEDFIITENISARCDAETEILRKELESTAID